MASAEQWKDGEKEPLWSSAEIHTTAVGHSPSHSSAVHPKPDASDLLIRAVTPSQLLPPTNPRQEEANAQPQSREEQRKKSPEGLVAHRAFEVSIATL